MARVLARNRYGGKAPQELRDVAREQLRSDLRIALESGEGFDLPRKLTTRWGTRGATRNDADGRLIATSRRRLRTLLRLGVNPCKGHQRKRRQATPNPEAGHSRLDTRRVSYRTNPHS